MKLYLSIIHITSMRKETYYRSDGCGPTGLFSTKANVHPPTGYSTRNHYAIKASDKGKAEWRKQRPYAEKQDTAECWIHIKGRGEAILNICRKECVCSSREETGGSPMLSRTITRPLHASEGQRDYKTSNGSPAFPRGKYLQSQSQS